MSLACMLSGCTLLPMRNLQPVIAPPKPDGGVICKSEQTLLTGEPEKSGVVQYVLPRDAGQITIATNFEDYRAEVRARVAVKLPPELARHRVTLAFVDFLTSASGEAQLDAQISDNTLDRKTRTDQHKIADERASMKKYSSAPKLKYAELRDFTRKLFDLQLKHGPADFIGGTPDLAVLGPAAKILAVSRPKLETELVAYLKAYYDGSFYDRMGNAIAKPPMPQLPQGGGPISFSVPDTEVVAAETVLLEFLIDCIDPTPVMGDTETNDPDVTTYYPGGSMSEPTALATAFTSYKALPKDGCGITLANVWVLKDLASAASDQVGAIGGLVVNTPGGFSLGLGFLANISIGDNQTLSDMLKAAASDLALRATLATSYFSLRHVSFHPPHV